MHIKLGENMILVSDYNFVKRAVRKSYQILNSVSYISGFNTIQGDIIVLMFITGR